MLDTFPPFCSNADWFPFFLPNWGSFDENEYLAQVSINITLGLLLGALILFALCVCFD